MMRSAPVVAGGMVMLSVVFFAGDQVGKHYRAERDAAKAVHAGVSHLELELFAARRAEGEFAWTRDLAHTVAHDAVAAEFTAETTILHERLAAMGEHDEDVGVSRLSDAFDVYRAAFGRFVDLTSRLGVDETQGLQGALRASVHAVEAELKIIGAPEMMMKMLMMRQHEKNFIMRENKKYVGRLNDRVSEFRA
jgi:methyl-accepting chemotaxis protein